METKLTLKLDKEIIDSAKKYARIKHKSLSKLVEDFFKSLTINQKDSSSQVTPLVKELSGVIKEKHIKQIDNDYASYLESKYE